jgi:adenosylcobinamide kinase / adenosylcobinamide-phosphate guanylyltransferase
MTLILVTGGVRSGKSGFAEELAKKKGGKVLYQATGISCDQEMENRIERHRKRRPKEWGLLESTLDLSIVAYSEYDVILVDCLSTWVSNHLVQAEEKAGHWEAGFLSVLRKWLDSLSLLDQTVIVVTSEVGLGGVAMSSLGRAFQDFLGEANQMVAMQSDEVYAVMSGIPWRLK